MIKTKKSYLMLAVFSLICILLSGCQIKAYEEIYLPSLEIVEGDVHQTEETLSVESESVEVEVQSSALEPPVTTETAPEFTSVEKTVYVTGNDVNLRTGYTPASEVITRLKKGTALNLVGYHESWSRVVYEGKECYISTQYLSAEKPEAESSTEGETVKTGKLIAIDAGHQAKGNSEKEPIGPGSETKKAKVAGGATGISTGLPEYKLNLMVSKKLKSELETRGYQVVMIRETHDVDISNAERAEIANQSGADIFLRIHANSLNDSSVHGVLTMCQTSKNPYNGNLYAKSSALSKFVTDGISQVTGAKNRGVQETDSMSGINWCKTPVTIVEMGFLSNPQEDKNLSDDAYQNKIVKGIADGVDAYYAAGN